MGFNSFSKAVENSTTEVVLLYHLSLCCNRYSTRMRYEWKETFFGSNNLSNMQYSKEFLIRNLNTHMKIWNLAEYVREKQKKNLKYYLAIV